MQNSIFPVVQLTIIRVSNQAKLMRTLLRVTIHPNGEVGEPAIRIEGGRWDRCLVCRKRKPRVCILCHIPSEVVVTVATTDLP